MRRRVQGAPGTDAANRAAWDLEADRYAASLALHPLERALLGRLRDRWSQLAMLDLGVGAGRTSYTSPRSPAGTWAWTTRSGWSS